MDYPILYVLRGYCMQKKVSPYLTAGYGEKVKAYLRKGARPL